MAFVRLIAGALVAFGGGCIILLALAREFLADPVGLDWLDPSAVDQQVLGGDINNYLMFIVGALVFSFGACA